VPCDRSKRNVQGDCLVQVGAPERENRPLYEADERERPRH
jgi:hypothetical protein